MNQHIKDTKSAEYTSRLIRKQRVWWKHLIDVQAPYRWNLRRLKPGFMLDIGCGIGRNLLHVNGYGVGIDHNEQSIEIAKAYGLQAFTPGEFQKAEFKDKLYDTFLLAHVAEHMTQAQVVELLKEYIHLLKYSGRLIMICPQEAGYKSDASHVEFMDFQKLRNISRQIELSPLHEYSFPFPRFMGGLFTYNEFISISTNRETTYNLGK
jgi:2-polyprenyl-3-methyl-5-hydroxy-6-metoxy-1,4-benzoquinol methylase